MALTKQQSLGLQYATQKHNDKLPEGDTPLTIEEFTDLVIGQVGDHHYAELDREQLKLVKEKIDSLPEAEQKALRAQIGVEEVIKEKVVKIK